MARLGEQIANGASPAGHEGGRPLGASPHARWRQTPRASAVPTPKAMKYHEHASSRRARDVGMASARATKRNV